MTVTASATTPAQIDLASLGAVIVALVLQGQGVNVVLATGPAAISVSKTAG